MPRASARPSGRSGPPPILPGRPKELSTDDRRRIADAPRAKQGIAPTARTRARARYISRNPSISPKGRRRRSLAGPRKRPAGPNMGIGPMGRQELSASPETSLSKHNELAKRMFNSEEKP